MYVLAALNHHRTQAKLYQPECRKQSARACPDDDNLRLVRYVAIGNRLEKVVLHGFIDIDAHTQIDEDGALTGINGTLQDANARDAPCVQAILVGQESP